MKRLFLAVGLLLVTVGGIVAGTFAKNRAVDALVLRLDDIEATLKAGEDVSCRAQIAAFPAEVEQRTRWFHAIVPHNEIHALYESAAALPALYCGVAAGNVAGEGSELAVELTRCRTRLTLLRESGLPLLENIF